jgi:fatty acid desaturase
MPPALPTGACRQTRTEWPTLLLAVAVYGGWTVATAYHRVIPNWLLPILGGWFVAWHGSLQHETIHGHPTANRHVNALVGAMPLCLWLPYAVYRREHLVHHATEAITDPAADPESQYLTAETRPLSPIVHWLGRTQATLAGRLLLGPAILIVRSLVGESARLARSPRAFLKDWLPHLAGVALVLLWLGHCEISPLRYLLCFVYPGASLGLLRSFAEHRADPSPERRVAVVEQAGPLALLFLNNNLHVAHHLSPGTPWYRLPAFFRANRAALLARNGNLVYAGYGDVARHFLFRPHDVLVHPDHAVPAR